MDAYITTDAACETTCPDGSLPYFGNYVLNKDLQFCIFQFVFFEDLDLGDSGYYGEGNGVSGGLCRACDPKCTKCSGPLVCNECRGSRYLTPFFQCETSCPVGSYPHGEGKVGRACLPCPLGCASCTSEDTCLECTDDFFLAADQVCTKSCPDGFYGADSRDSVCTSFFAKRYNLGTFSEAASGMTDTVMMVSDTNPEKCCAACAAAEGCGGFEIVDGKCYMKGDLSKLTRHGGW